MVIIVMYACAVTCGRSFTVLSVWGVLISFWSVSVFSSAFFRHFFRGTICLSCFTFPTETFLVFFFSQKNWRHFAVAYVVADSSVLAHSSMVFSRFSSMPSTRPMLYNQAAVLLPAPPFSGDSVAVSAVASGPFDFTFKQDGSSGGPNASSVRPNFHCCISCR